MRFYISGPMRWHPKFNFPSFDAVAAILRKQGHVVDNPAEHDRETQPGIETWEGFDTGDPTLCPLFDYDIAMQWDLCCVAKNDAIVMLPDWVYSAGARLERFVAEHTGSQIFFSWQRRNGIWEIRPDSLPKRMGQPYVLGYEEVLNVTVK